MNFGDLKIHQKTNIQVVFLKNMYEGLTHSFLFEVQLTQNTDSLRLRKGAKGRQKWTEITHLGRPGSLPAT